MKTNQAEVIRELTPIDDQAIHGVTYDGKLVWFAREGELVAFDPETSSVVRRHALPSASGGTAFDGTHLYQLGGGRIFVVEPETGKVVRQLPAPARGEDSGMAYADGYLWVGHYRGKKIHKVDAKTGELVKTLSSDRFVTGVSCSNGELWHATSGDGQGPELRRLSSDGTVDERVAVPVKLISGMERTTRDTFWCAGEEGRLRLVKKSGS